METGQFEAIADQLDDIKYLLEILASDKLRTLLEQVLFYSHANTMSHYPTILVEHLLASTQGRNQAALAKLRNPTLDSALIRP